MLKAVTETGSFLKLVEKSWDSFEGRDGSMVPPGSKSMVSFTDDEGQHYLLRVDRDRVDEVRKVCANLETGDAIQAQVSIHDRYPPRVLALQAVKQK